MNSSLDDGNFSVENNINQPRVKCLTALTCTIVTTFSIIFICSVVSNVLVIVGVRQNSNFRTNMNMLLFNLSLANLLFAAVVMPCTIVSFVQSSFIFGAAFCVIYNYTQGVSVGLSAFTLTVLSLERYYAICKPLTSMHRQSSRHCLKMIAGSWILTLIVMTPIAVMSRLEVSPNGKWKKCREDWQAMGLKEFEVAYTIFLDVILFGVPLIIMTSAYVNIGMVMSRSVRPSKAASKAPSAVSPGCQTALADVENEEGRQECEMHKSVLYAAVRPTVNIACPVVSEEINVGRHHPQRSIKVRLNRKKKVIRLIVIVVLEFFICWSPVYALQTWMSINEESARKYVSSTMNLALRILAYASTFVYPFTYCFMNENFRRKLCNCNGFFRQSNKYRIR